MSRKKKTKSYYYDIREDLEKYPDALFVIVYGGRGTGKTYSGLRMLVEDDTPFCFIKRTLIDVNILVSGSKMTSKNGAEQAEMDASPFYPLNRDFGWNIRPFMAGSAQVGLGGFYECDEKNQPIKNKKPVGYIAALSGIGKIKGFNLDCDVLVYDEFCPKSYERVSTHEENEILDLYKTISRDREHRGKEPLKLFAFANSDNVVCPLTKAFGLLNVLAEMAVKDQEYYYNQETRVLLHKLKTSDEFLAKESQSPIYKATAGSKWTRMALSNDFAFNDFTNIGKKPMKNMICEAKICYDGKLHYVYYDNATASRYVTYSSSTSKPMFEYNLDKQIHKRKFVAYAELKVLQLFYGCEEPWFETFDLKNLYCNARKILL